VVSRGVSKKVDGLASPSHSKRSEIATKALSQIQLDHHPTKKSKKEKRFQKLHSSVQFKVILDHDPGSAPVQQAAPS
jgi:hypothetical protein